MLSVALFSILEGINWKKNAFAMPFFGAQIFHNIILKVEQTRFDFAFIILHQLKTEFKKKWQYVQANYEVSI